MNRTLVLVGGGLLQSPVIEIAHRKNVHVLCLDADPNAYCKSIADFFFVVDIKDRTACLEKVVEFSRNRSVNGVVTVGTDFSTTVAWIAEKLGLPGIPFEAAQKAKDKALMRQVLREAGVSSPEYQVISAPPQGPFRPTFDFPAVVKPVDNMGARGVRKVENEHEATVAIAEAFGYSNSGKVIVEQWIDGPEFSLDAIVRKEQFFRMGFADRTIILPPYFVEIGHSFPSRFPSSVVESVWETFEKGVRALGIDWGAAKGDIKFSNGRAVVGEIAARLSGGYMSGWTFPLSSGQSSILWAVENALGDPLTPQGDASSRVVVERSWINLPGRVASIDGLENVKKSSGVQFVFFSLKPGSQTKFPRNNVEKGGNLLVTADDLEEAQALAAQARLKLSVRLEAPHEETNRFFEKSDFWWFSSSDLDRKKMQTDDLFLKGENQTFSKDFGPQLRSSSLVDLYDNPIQDVITFLEKEGIDFESYPPIVWFYLLKGGAQGIRYFKDLYDRSYFAFQR